jgi:hypothetical protein
MRILWVSAGALAFACCLGIASTGPGAVRAQYAQLPLAFEANEGQMDASVRFVARGPGYNLFLTDSEAVLALRRGGPQGEDTQDAGPSKAVRLTVRAASSSARIIPDGALPGTV